MFFSSFYFVPSTNCFLKRLSDIRWVAEVVAAAVRLQLKCRWGEMAFADFPLLLDLNGTDRGHAAVGTYSTISTCPPTQSRGQESRCERHCSKETNTDHYYELFGGSETLLPTQLSRWKQTCKLYHTERKEAILLYFCVSLHEAQELSHTVWGWSVWESLPSNFW